MPMSFDLFQARTDLQNNWETLHDVDKAAQIIKIGAAGMSARTLAKSLDKSPSLIRRLRTVDDAFPEEKILARKGKISTNKLVRLVEGRRRRKDQLQDEIDSERRATETKLAAKEIVAWLLTKLSPAYAEQVIDEARGILADAFHAGTLPKFRAPESMAITDIINRCEPKKSGEDDFNFVSHFASWLARWTFFAFPDPCVRDNSLTSAWGTIIK